MIGDGKYIFGERYFEDFKVGSMVSWKPINKEKQYGIITKTFTQQIENDHRYIAFASITSTSGISFDLMLGNLELVSDVHKCPTLETKDG